jgi:uncharacterized protein YcfJ
MFSQLVRDAPGWWAAAAAAVAPSSAVAGGLWSNQVGGPRQSGPAAGAVIGAITGDRLQNNQPQQVVQAPPRSAQLPTVTDMQRRLTGYRVPTNAAATSTDRDARAAWPERAGARVSHPLEERGTIATDPRTRTP